MKRLAGAHELLDGALEDLEALQGNLRDLRSYNSLLGGAALSRKAVFGLLDGMSGEATIIDVGTGAADIPVALLRAARRRGRKVRVIAADSRAEVLVAARALQPALERLPGLQLCVADGRSLDWPDRSFDVAHSSMTVHHLEPREAVAFLREMKRVSRRGVVVNDLARAELWLAIARHGTPLVTRNPLTRNDAPLSVARAYTRREMVRLLEAAALRPVHAWGGILGHRYAIAAVPR